MNGSGRRANANFHPVQCHHQVTRLPAKGLGQHNQSSRPGCYRSRRCLRRRCRLGLSLEQAQQSPHINIDGCVLADGGGGGVKAVVCPGNAEYRDLLAPGIVPDTITVQIVCHHNSAVAPGTIPGPKAAFNFVGLQQPSSQPEPFLQFIAGDSYPDINVHWWSLLYTNLLRKGPACRARGDHFRSGKVLVFLEAAQLMARHGQVGPGTVQHQVQEDLLVAFQRANQVVLLGQADQHVFNGVVQIQAAGHFALGAQHFGIASRSNFQVNAGTVSGHHHAAVHVYQGRCHVAVDFTQGFKVDFCHAELSFFCSVGVGNQLSMVSAKAWAASRVIRKAMARFSLRSTQTDSANWCCLQGKRTVMMEPWLVAMTLWEHWLCRISRLKASLRDIMEQPSAATRLLRMLSFFAVNASERPSSVVTEANTQALLAPSTRLSVPWQAPLNWSTTLELVGLS